MAQWSTLPFEIQANILQYLPPPFQTHVCRSWHYITQKFIYRSVRLHNQVHLSRFLKCLEFTQLGALVKCIQLPYSFSPNAIYNLATQCPNVTELKSMKPNLYSWLPVPTPIVYWENLEILPAPERGNEDYVNVIKNYKHLREITLSDGLSIDIKKDILDQLHQFDKLQTIHVQHMTSNIELTRLIRERDYLSHVEIKEEVVWDYETEEEESEDYDSDGYDGWYPLVMERYCDQCGYSHDRETTEEEEEEFSEEEGDEQEAESSTRNARVINPAINTSNNRGPGNQGLSYLPTLSQARENQGFFYPGQTWRYPNQNLPYLNRGLPRQNQGIEEVITVYSSGEENEPPRSNSIIVIDSDSEFEQRPENNQPDVVNIDVDEQQENSQPNIANTNSEEQQPNIVNVTVEQKNNQSAIVNNTEEQQEDNQTAIANVAEEQQDSSQSGITNVTEEQPENIQPNIVNTAEDQRENDQSNLVNDAKEQPNLINENNVQETETI
ncbi:hypothetical protein G6F56_006220 [Rhizopus delemar]|nr:hypothetical protein G6F56_006220 [Rhizopus delemar]